MAPSEFWALSPTEFWLEFDFRYEEQQRLLKASDDSKPGAGGFTASEWAAARAKHKEKMNG